MRFYFNNARRRNHARLFPARAFFDLYRTGEQGTMATNIEPGDECIVATPAEHGYVEFTSYKFSHERTVDCPDEPGKEVRVLFGREVSSEMLPRTEAVKT